MIVDAYAGPGGWSQGLRALSLSDVGVELDPAACATRAAAGHTTIRTDVAAMPLDHLTGRVDGLIMSPPCQTFSTAGNGEGRILLDVLCQSVRRGAWWEFDRDEGYGHILEVGRWAETIRPTWVACEQVPPVMPVWATYATRWRAMGWSAWAGILNAADYGVPQTRRRAFLIARTDGQAVGPPPSTHVRGGAVTLFGQLEPWVSMADALGWNEHRTVSDQIGTGQAHTPYYDSDRPSRTVTSIPQRTWVGDTPARTLCGDRSPRWLYPDHDGTHGRVLDRRQNPDGTPVPVVDCDTEPAPTLTGIAGAKSQWIFKRPATTVTCQEKIASPFHGEFCSTDNAIRLTIRDALILQGFPPDYPLQGTRTKQFEQVGNAVPPPLAAAVLAAVTGRQIGREAT